MINKLSIGLLGLVMVAAGFVSAATGSNPKPENPSASSPAADRCINIQSALFIGRRGPEVSDLQVFLKAKGYLKSEVTGYFGPVTFAAVRSFQGDQGLSRVGIVGPLTRAKLKVLSCGQANKPGEIILTSIKANDVVSLPLRIQGKAAWSPFEGEMGSVILYNSQGQALSNVGLLSVVVDDWMERAMRGEKFDFDVTLTKLANSPALSGAGYLEFKNNNPSDLRERDRSFRLPVQFAPTGPIPVTESFMTVKVAVLADREDTTKTGPIRACDKVIMAPVTVAKLPAVLDAALKTLFSYQPGGAYEGFRNFVKTQTNLKYDRVTLEQGIAKIYLTGSLGPIAGMCDEPRLQTQLEETAFQFPTVISIRVYLNGNLQDWSYRSR